MSEQQPTIKVDEDCPNGGKHNLVRRVRDHPTEPGWRQDGMFCLDCFGVLYPWKTMRGTRHSG